MERLDGSLWAPSMWGTLFPLHRGREFGWGTFALALISHFPCSGACFFWDPPPIKGFFPPKAEVTLTWEGPDIISLHPLTLALSSS